MFVLAGSVIARSAATKQSRNRRAPRVSPPAPTEANSGPLRPILGADRKRQPELAKRRLEHWPRMAGVGPVERLAAQQIAAHRVADRQRVAALAVAGSKPALEVGAPDRIGRAGGLKRRNERRTAAPARPGQALLAQPLADGARRRRTNLGQALDQLAAQLLGAKRRIALAQRQRRLDSRLVARLPMHERRATALLQPLEALRLMARKPFVAGLAADPERGANLAHRCLVIARRQHKTHPFIHRPGLSPRHQRGLPRRSNDLSTIYPVQSVSDLIRSNTTLPLPMKMGEGTTRRALEGAAPPSVWQLRPRATLPLCAFLLSGAPARSGFRLEPK